jgi:hypothetical protein
MFFMIIGNECVVVYGVQDVGYVLEGKWRCSSEREDTKEARSGAQRGSGKSKV